MHQLPRIIGKLAEFDGAKNMLQKVNGGICSIDNEVRRDGSVSARSIRRAHESSVVDVLRRDPGVSRRNARDQRPGGEQRERPVRCSAWLEGTFSPTPLKPRNLVHRENQPYAPALARSTPEEPTLLQRHNHAMHRGRRHVKEPLHVSLRGSYPMERRVCLDEGQVLPLKVSELRFRSRRALARHDRGVTPPVLLTLAITRGGRASGPTRHERAARRRVHGVVRPHARSSSTGAGRGCCLSPTKPRTMKTAQSSAR